MSISSKFSEIFQFENWGEAGNPGGNMAAFKSLHVQDTLCTYTSSMKQTYTTCVCILIYSVQLKWKLNHINHRSFRDSIEQFENTVNDHLQTFLISNITAYLLHEGTVDAYNCDYL